MLLLHTETSTVTYRGPKESPHLLGVLKNKLEVLKDKFLTHWGPANIQKFL